MNKITIRRIKEANKHLNCQSILSAYHSSFDFIFSIFFCSKSFIADNDWCSSSDANRLFWRDSNLQQTCSLFHNSEHMNITLLLIVPRIANVEKSIYKMPLCHQKFNENKIVISSFLGELGSKFHIWAHSPKFRKICISSVLLTF